MILAIVWIVAYLGAFLYTILMLFTMRPLFKLKDSISPITTQQTGLDEPVKKGKEQHWSIGTPRHYIVSCDSLCLENYLRTNGGLSLEDVNKPSSTLIDAVLKIKLTDFGSVLRLPEGRRNSEPERIYLLPMWYVIDVCLAIDPSQRLPAEVLQGRTDFVIYRFKWQFKRISREF
ncbi:hypothetical protein BDY19DRAFT_997809 [Irpex rosettiformis]|uniref:Uncharacterized protein n=1 Tax=Irpex rosettiformis TaxID=378272 RepID=A0ACB8TQM1_9APHY|nr:hypothetical protein BDY19DRAFT_997809 [Irpex rosettiformis]